MVQLASDQVFQAVLCRQEALIIITDGFLLSFSIERRRPLLHQFREDYAWLLNTDNRVVCQACDAANSPHTTYLHCGLVAPVELAVAALVASCKAYQKFQKRSADKLGRSSVNGRSASCRVYASSDDHTDIPSEVEGD